MLKASRQGKWSLKTLKGNLRYSIVGIAFILTLQVLAVIAQHYYCYNDNFSCLVSFRSAFQSQQYKPSLNLTL